MELVGKESDRHSLPVEDLEELGKGGQGLELGEGPVAGQEQAPTVEALDLEAGETVQKLVWWFGVTHDSDSPPAGHMLR